MKFPKELHVVIEQSAGERPYLLVPEDGVNSLTEPQAVALYQLVGVGRVTIDRQFTWGKKKAAPQS